MTGRFPYRASQADPSPADPSPVVWRPVVPVTLWGLGRKVNVEGLVDTGATETILPISLWDRVEAIAGRIEESQLEAANGTVIRVRYGTVDLGLKLGQHKVRWGAKLAFSPDRNEPVLGYIGFLQHFRATFDGPGRRLDIQTTKPMPPSISPFGRRHEPWIPPVGQSRHCDPGGSSRSSFAMRREGRQSVASAGMDGEGLRHGVRHS